MISCCHKQLNTTCSLQRFHKHNRKCSYSQSSVICFFKQLAAPIQMLVCRAPHHYRCSPPEIRKSPVHIGQGTSTNGHRGCQYRTLFKPSHQCCSSLRSVPFCRGAGVGQRRFLCPQNGTGWFSWYQITNQATAAWQRTCCDKTLTICQTCMMLSSDTEQMTHGSLGFHEKSEIFAVWPPWMNWKWKKTSQSRLCQVENLFCHFMIWLEPLSPQIQFVGLVALTRKKPSLVHFLVSKILLNC